MEILAFKGLQIVTVNSTELNLSWIIWPLVNMAWGFVLKFFSKTLQKMLYQLRGNVNSSYGIYWYSWYSRGLFVCLRWIAKIVYLKLQFLSRLLSLDQCKRKQHQLTTRIDKTNWDGWACSSLPSIIWAHFIF